MITTKGTFDMNYVTPGKSQKEVEAKVELVTAADGQRKLKVSKVSNKKSKALEEICVEDIGALVITQLVCKKRKDNHQLLIFWRKLLEGTEWSCIQFSGSAQHLASYKALKEKLHKLLYNWQFQMQLVPDGRLYELQCSDRYVAIVPSDSDTQEYTTISDLKSYISGVIYRKSSNEICLLPQEDPSLIHTVSFRTAAHNRTFTYKLSFQTFDRISRELKCERREDITKKPLPLVPQIVPRSVSLGDSASNSRSLSLDGSTSGSRPHLRKFFSIDPKWMNLQVPPPGCTPYRERKELEEFLPKKLEHVGQVCSKPPSQRFNKFVTSARFGPSSITELNETAEEEIYSPPKLARRLFSDTGVLSETSSFCDNVESTLTECINKIVRGETTNTDLCPLGMTKNERQTFCWRLDLVEYDVLHGPGWKVFADHVMVLNSDDLEMFDEFSCKYKYQVVEIILDHWYKLYKMSSAKCKSPAVKQTIVNVLNVMKRELLLEQLGWEIHE